MANPAAWDEMMNWVYPIIMADTFAYEPEDHYDDGVPVTAAEWDVM